MGRQFTAALLAVVTCAVAFPIAGQQPEQKALQALDACIARLDAHVDVGFERIAARCPDLARQLEASGWSAWLPVGWKESGNDLSAGSLKELRVLIQRELGTQAQGRTPDVESLQEILADIGQGERERQGLWARFRRWLQSLFETRDETKRSGWFDRMVDRVGLSQAVIELLTYATLGLIVALAMLIIVNELRATGVLRRRRVGSVKDSTGVELSAPAHLSWEHVERAPLSDKPRLLLELVIDKLTQQQRLPPAGSFTVRELTRTAQLTDAEDRSRLTELALTAESVRYSARETPRSVLETAVERGRELLERIESGNPRASVEGMQA